MFQCLKRPSCSWSRFHSGIVVSFLIVVLDRVVEGIRFVGGRASLEKSLMNFLYYSINPRNFLLFGGYGSLLDLKDFLVVMIRFNTIGRHHMIHIFHSLLE